MKCHYEVLGVPPDCASDDLKKAYRKLALEWHPDKNLHRLSEATETFQLIQQAYETLIDPQERAWYDRHKEEILRGDAEEAYKDDSLNVYQYFNVSCFKGYNDEEKGFYTVFRHVFEKIAAEDKPFLDSDDELEVPNFGYSYSSYEEIVHNFYAYWQSYCTVKSYSWIDKFDLTEARKSGVGRQVIRLMEKENKKLREQCRKTRNEEVRALVAFVRKRDKRIQVQKKKEEERKIEKAKRAGEIRKQQLLERNKSLESYKESEWLTNSELENRFNELENAIDETFGTNSTNDADDDDEEEEIDALYCVACEKDFRSEKAMKNHENSKKHKENVTLLRYLMEEEEAAFQNDEEKVIGEQSSPLAESDAEETSEALLVELVKSSSKSKKKKKRNKNVVTDTRVNNDIENEEELNSKLEAVNIDGPPKDSNCMNDKEPLKKCHSHSSTEMDKKIKTRKEKISATVTVCGKEEEIEEKPNTICEKCNQTFKSRNKLFEHLKESGHAIYMSSGSTKKRKKSQL